MKRRIAALIVLSLPVCALFALQSLAQTREPSRARMLWTDDQNGWVTIGRGRPVTVGLDEGDVSSNGRFHASVNTRHELGIGDLVRHTYRPVSAECADGGLTRVRWVDAHRVLCIPFTGDWSRGDPADVRSLRLVDVRSRTSTVVYDPAPADVLDMGNPINAVAFSARAGRVAVKSRGKVRVLGFDGDQVGRAVDCDCTQDGAISMSPDGSRVAWPIDDEGVGRLRVLDVAAGRVWSVSARVGYQSAVSKPVFSPTGSKLAVMIGTDDEDDAPDLLILGLDRAPARRVVQMPLLITRIDSWSRGMGLVVAAPHMAASHEPNQVDYWSFRSVNPATGRQREVVRARPPQDVPEWSQPEPRLLGVR